MLSLAYVKLVSSTNIHAQECVRKLGRSLIKFKTRSGPSIVPWGIPHQTKQLLDACTLIKHIC